MRIAITKISVLRLIVAVPLLVAGLGAASAVASVGPAAPLCAQAGDASRVSLVVEHGDGRVVRRCVGFNGSTTTALAILETSGLETGLLSYGALGTAICQIDNEPARYSDCLPSSGSYWVLFVARAGGAWSDSARGASSVTVADGDDVGFRYDPQTGADPPPPSPRGTCPATTPPPARTGSPSPAGGRGGATAVPGASAPAATGGVLGETAPAAAASPKPRVTGVAAAASPAVDLGLLAAAGGGGGLIGLLAVQGLRRRRR